MKKLLYLAVLIFFMNCSGRTNKNEKIDSSVRVTQIDTISAGDENLPAVAADKLIIPGEKVGHIYIGQDAATLDSILGAPTMSDAAMGKAWTTWKGKPDEHNNPTQLDIYTTYKDSNMNEKTVQQIRTTSSFFSTGSGIHVYSDLPSIKNQFPSVVKVATYSEGGRQFQIYDDVKNGIAFEIVSANQQNICTGIIIHIKDKPVTDTYIYLHPEMEVMG